MARLQIVYEVSDDIEEIIDEVEKHVNLTSNESKIFDLLQTKFQVAFDEGRKFQKQLSDSDDFKDSIAFKSKID